MQRQGITVPAAHLEEMVAIMNALHAGGRGRMFVTHSPDDVPRSAVFMGIDVHRAYGMFGGSDPSTRDLPTGTAVLWDAFTALSASGVSSVDLEGVNSPSRGWFKLSFGGSFVPYYRAILDQRLAP